MEWTQEKIKFSVLRLSLWCVLWGTSCLLFVYVRRFSKHFYSIIFTEALENISTWKTEIYILFFIMKNIAEWIFINTLFAFASSGAVFLRLFLPYSFTSEALKFSFVLLLETFSYETKEGISSFSFSSFCAIMWLWISKSIVCAWIWSSWLMRSLG